MKKNLFSQENGTLPQKRAKIVSFSAVSIKQNDILSTSITLLSALQKLLVELHLSLYTQG